MTMYPRTDCPVCSRDVAVSPIARRICRHDPATGRTEDLRSCPGSQRSHTPGPGEPGYQGDQQGLFVI